MTPSGPPPPQAVRILVVSHRGPVTFQRVRGRLRAVRGAGGLVGALAPVLQRMGGTWLASTLSAEDEAVARDQPQGREVDGFRLRFLALPPPEHRLHYDVVSNEHLWFLFHYLFDTPHAPVFDASFAQAWEGYRTINRLYAEAVASEAAHDAVLVQDFHLITLGEELRALRPRLDRPLVYFHHTPWCEPDYFSLLPEGLRRELLRGMLAYDVVGFHATRWARSFLACCERHLPRASVGEQEVGYEGRRVRVVVDPVPLDVPRLQAEAASPPTEAWIQRLEAMRAGRRVLLRVDRVELSKNVLRGLLAYELLLSAEPALAQDVWFCALVYPSRPRVAEYRRYLGACLAAAQRINERFRSRSRGGEPLSLLVHDDYHRSLAGMRLAEALLVNPIFDGLNLVAKEGVVAGDRSPALVLSRNAGVWEELGSEALGINPFDVAETASALARALGMPATERAERAARLRRMVAARSPEGWVRGQLQAAGLG